AVVAHRIAVGRGAIAVERDQDVAAEVHGGLEAGEAALDAGDGVGRVAAEGDVVELGRLGEARAHAVPVAAVDGEEIRGEQILDGGTIGEPGDQSVLHDGSESRVMRGSCSMKSVRSPSMRMVPSRKALTRSRLPDCTARQSLTAARSVASAPSTM